MTARWHRKSVLLAMMALLACGGATYVLAGDEDVAVERHYAKTPDVKMGESQEEADAKSAGCISCHTASDAPSMHENIAVVIGCADCHGGDATVTAPKGLDPKAAQYASLRDRAHVLPRYPENWHYPSSANPKESYTLLNREAPEFVRFVNPSDYRVARESCGACHLTEIQAAERSLMATGAMFFEGASYNNGILPMKGGYDNVLDPSLKGVGVGEAYTRDGQAAKVVSPGSPPGTITEDQKKRGALTALIPLPTWQVVPPADIFRVFERGGRTIGTEFPEIGLPDSTGSIQKLEEPGRPDLKQSNRGPGTGLRVAIPVLNIHKTRLNDPFMWFMGTNDQPGDYRQSGCAGCHVIYANSREPRESLTYAPFGRDGKSQTVDPTINKDESGHPIRHVFSRSIPTAQCMNCHMHQPNMFLNTYLGYTMWDYESDAPSMWPKEQKYPTSEEMRKVLDRNPEGAAPRGKWADVDFLRNVYDLNPKLKDTQFADYHGHGWNFRAILKRDREGNLLDEKGNIVKNDDPEKWRKNGVGKFGPIGQQAGKAVHMMDIHAEKGMQCSDCHFAQDSHGSGLIMGEVANAVEIGCKDCHGGISAYPTLKTSGPAAPPGGTDLSLLRNQDGSRRFQWSEEDGRKVLYQVS
ncbi:MAG TPA: multiheme c-type cytochrome, partial [Rhizomicrobium sp.]